MAIAKILKRELHLKEILKKIALDEHLGGGGGERARNRLQTYFSKADTTKATGLCYFAALSKSLSLGYTC